MQGVQLQNSLSWRDQGRLPEAETWTSIIEESEGEALLVLRPQGKQETKLRITPEGLPCKPRLSHDSLLSFADEEGMKPGTPPEETTGM